MNHLRNIHQEYPIQIYVQGHTTKITSKGQPKFEERMSLVRIIV